MSASADRDSASTALRTPRTPSAGARRRLEQAQDDLDDAKRRGHQAEQDAKDAARTAAGAFDGVAGHSPAAAVFGGSPTAVENQVLARVRAGDYSVLDEVAVQLPARGHPARDRRRDRQGVVQARPTARAATRWRTWPASSALPARRRVRHRLLQPARRQGAHDLATNIIFFHGTAKGLKDPSLVALMAPFATLLGTATRSKDLRSDFTDDFIGDGTRSGTGSRATCQMAAFLMAGQASNYCSKFLARIGRGDPGRAAGRRRSAAVSSSCPTTRTS